MSGALATPSTSMFIASFPTRQLIRLVTKPGNSLTSTVSLPIFSAAPRAIFTVSSVVSRPRISSTSFIRCAGLKKCMAIQRSGRFVPAAISVGLIVEVFVARTVSGLHSSSNFLNKSSLRSIFSSTASMTRSTPETASSRSSVVWMRSRAFRISPSSSLPFSTASFISFSILCVALSRASPLMSCNLTPKPPTAAAWAIPLPITPAPTMATFSASMRLSRAPYFFGFQRLRRHLLQLLALDRDAVGAFGLREVGEGDDPLRHLELCQVLPAQLQNLVLVELLSFSGDDEAERYGASFGGNPDHLRLGDARQAFEVALDLPRAYEKAPQA